MILLSKQPVTIQIIYYMPDYPSILQEFVWNYEDRIPELIRTHQFLNHWKQNIDAIISEVMISMNDTRRRQWRSIDTIVNLN